MASRIKASVYNFLGLTANIVVIAVQTVILFPQFLAKIGERAYGAWLSSGDVFLWMASFDLGLTNLMIQKIGSAHSKNKTDEVGRWFANSLLVLAILSTLLAAAGVGLSWVVPSWYHLTSSEARAMQGAFALASIAVAGVVLNNALVGYARGVQRTGLLNLTGFIAAVANLGVTLLLLSQGYGLFAIAWGLVSRTAILALGGFLFFLTDIPGEVKMHMKINRDTMGEIWRIAPISALGGLSYAAMNQSELLIAGTLGNQNMAVILYATRKAIDIARGLADTVTFSTYGAFSHLVASDQKHRSLTVYRELISFRTAIAVAMAAAYIAVNASFVHVWVSAGQFGGIALTAVVGIQSILIGGSYFVNYLYRATGEQVRGSYMLLAEAVLRIGLMMVFLKLFGLVGLVAAGAITSAIFIAIVHRWTLKKIQPFSETSPPIPLGFWIACGALLALSIVPTFWIVPTWGYVLGLGTGLAAFGFLGLIWMNPYTLRIRRQMLESLFFRPNQNQ